MRLGAVRVEIAANPDIVDECLRRGLQLYRAQNAAEARNRLRRPELGRGGIRDLNHKPRLLARLHKIGDLELPRGAIVEDVRDGHIVHPEPSLTPNATDFQPDALALPVRRDREGAPVPTIPRKTVRKREVDGVARVTAARRSGDGVSHAL